MNYKVPLYVCLLAFSNTAFTAVVEDFDEDSFDYEEQEFVQNDEMDVDLFDEALADSYGSSANTPIDASPAPSRPYRKHYSLYGDFLYWQPVVNDSYWGLQSQSDTSTKQYRFNFDWDIGFRVGAAFKTTWEDLTFDLNWTRFHTTSTNTHSDQSLFTAPFGAFPRYSLYGLPYSLFSFGNPWKIQSKYKVHFDQIDLTFKKPLRFGKRKTFTMSPFGGVRGIVTHYSLHSTRYSTNYGTALSTPGGPQDSSTVNVSDKMKSIGLLAGMNGDLMLGYGFGFYFGGDFFIGYGPDKSKNTSQDNFAGAVIGSDSISQNTNAMRTMFDISTGFSWNRNFLKERLNLLFSAGYEFHALNNAPLLLYNGSGGDSSFSNEPSKTTAFQGLTMRAGIYF